LLVCQSAGLVSEKPAAESIHPGESRTAVVWRMAHLLASARPIALSRLNQKTFFLL